MTKLAKYGLPACLASLAVSCTFLSRTATTIDPGSLGKQTYVISAPGEYRLGGDVLAGGLAPGAPVIRIAADNVTLDLGGHTIRMPASAPGRNAGIEINGRSSVTITNGSFAELSGPGIHVVCDVDPSASRCTNFTFSRLDMRNVGRSGEYRDLGNLFNRPFSGGIIVFGRSTEVPAAGGRWENSIVGMVVTRVTVRNDKTIKHLFPGSPPAGGQNGLTFASVTSLRVEDISVSGMTSNDAAACIFLGRTHTVVVRRFECRDATGDRNANGLDSMANTVKPPAIKKNYDVRVEDSSFANIRATGPRGNEALGVELNGEKFTFVNVAVADVENDNTNAEGNRAVGLQINANGASEEISRVTGCTVKNVTNRGAGRDSRAGGVSIEGAPPVVVSRCTVSNVANLGSGSASIKAFGFRVEPSTRRMVLDENDVDGVIAPAVAKGSPGYAAGFALVNARADMSRNTASRAPVGLFASNLTTDAGIRGNFFQCNATPVVPSGFLDRTDNVVTAASACAGR